MRSGDDVRKLLSVLFIAVWPCLFVTMEPTQGPTGLWSERTHWGV